MKKNESTIQIDKLKLCFLAPIIELKYLQDKPSVLFLGDYKLKPVIDDRFDYCYDVYQANTTGELLFDIDEIEDWCNWGLDAKEPEIPIAQIKFSNNIDRNKDYVYLILKIYNHVLYSDILAEVVRLPFLLGNGIKFNNFSELHIALDTQQNIPSLIKKMLRDKSITTLINRKVIEERDEIIQGVFFEYSTTLNRLKYPSITLKQKKAHKDKGAEIQAYNKLAEIRNQSGKFYILKHYGNPKKLYRLEVRLPYQPIKDYHVKKGIEEDMNLIFDKEKLLEMFLFYLNSVVSFRDRSRKKIPWKTLLKMSSQGI